MENNEPLVSITLSEYDRLLETNFRYSILLNSILKKHSVSLSWDKRELVLSKRAEALLMEIMKTSETKRYNQIFEELIKEDKKEN